MLSLLGHMAQQNGSMRPLLCRDLKKKKLNE